MADLPDTIPNPYGDRIPAERVRTVVLLDWQGRPRGHLDVIDGTVVPRDRHGQEVMARTGNPHRLRIPPTDAVHWLPAASTEWRVGTSTLFRLVLRPGRQPHRRG